MKIIFVEFRETLSIALRAIRANKLRAVLTTLGIIIGIVAVTTMSTAIVGLREAFIGSISSFGSDVLYVDKFPWFAMGDWATFRNRKDITYEQYEKLRASLKNYEAMAPCKTTFGTTVKRNEKSVQATMVYGTTEEFQKTSQINPEDGRFLNALDVLAARRVCVVGKDIANELFPSENPINQDVRINNVPMKIIGVLEKQGSGFLGSYSLDGQIIMPLKVFESVVGTARNRLRIDVKIGDVDKLEDAREEIIAEEEIVETPITTEINEEIPATSTPEVITPEPEVEVTPEETVSVEDVVSEVSETVIEGGKNAGKKVKETVEVVGETTTAVIETVSETTSETLEQISAGVETVAEEVENFKGAGNLAATKS